VSRLRPRGAAAGPLPLLLLLAVPALASDASRESPPRSLPDLLRAEMSVLDALDTAVFEARRYETRARSAEAQRSAAEARLSRARQALEEARAREAQARGRLDSTMRLLRAAEPFGSAAVQVLLGGDEELSRRAALLSRLTARQAADAKAMAEAVAAAETAGFTAGIERASAHALAVSAREARERLDEEVALRRALLHALDRDRALQAKHASELDASQRELVRTIQARKGSRPGPIDFQRLRGRVKSPLAGARVVVPFGDVVHPVFKTRTPHPGLTLEFPSSQPRNVRAVAFGRVAWTGHMRGLGTTVLLDHASGWFSVYGGLSGLQAREGAVVHEGDLLGQVEPAPGDKGARLYFELRREAAAVDPRPYLAR